MKKLIRLIFNNRGDGLAGALTGAAILGVATVGMMQVTELGQSSNRDLQTDQYVLRATEYLRFQLRSRDLVAGKTICNDFVEHISAQPFDSGELDPANPDHAALLAPLNLQNSVALSTVENNKVDVFSIRAGELNTARPDAREDIRVDFTFRKRLKDGNKLFTRGFNIPVRLNGATLECVNDDELFNDTLKIVFCQQLNPNGAATIDEQCQNVVEEIEQDIRTGLCNSLYGEGCKPFFRDVAPCASNTYASGWTPNNAPGDSPGDFDCRSFGW